MGPHNNERLEYLGDAALGFVIARQLYDLFPQAEEGALSRLRANLVNQTSLAELAKDLNIGDYLILGSGELKSGGFRRDSILSDALEAIIGALLLDQGFETCNQWILSLFAEKLSALAYDSWAKDPKTRLQELMQARKQSLPLYSLVTQTGASHEQTFQVSCQVPLLDESTLGIGVSRKKAEQEAARKMLHILEQTSA